MAGRGADIIGIGMTTPIGIGARQTAASVRAGIARQRQSSIHNRRFHPMVLATVPEDQLDPLEESLLTTRGLTSRQSRMLKLAGSALREAVRGTNSHSDTPVFLGVPESIPGRPDPVGSSFLDQLAKQSGVTFHQDASHMIANGRAAGILALAEAIKLLEGGAAREVLVGGVDSYLDLYLLDVLDRESRVLADGVMDGFAPGEGAAFLWLRSANAGAAPNGERNAPLAHIAAVATGVETGHRYSTEAYRGDGLAKTFQSLFAVPGAADAPVETVFASLNGENFGAKEWGTAYLRSRSRFAESMHVEHPIDCFGDVGAALGPVMLGLGALGVQQGYVAEPCLVYCSSDREERGAALVRRAQKWGMR